MKEGSRSIAVESGFYRRLADLAAAGHPMVVVTVIEASGSSPGKAGAKMIVTGDAFHGTVGGGRVEKAALQRARERLGSEAGPEMWNVNVVQDLGMTCGGTMNLLFEPITPAPRLVIFGAGHISKPLCAVGSAAGFHVTVCDEREDWLTEERFPGAAARILAPWEEAVKRAEIDSRTFVTSVTPGHGFDQRVVMAIVEAGLEPRYLGVIGSRRKAVVLRQGLVEKGVDPARVEALHIPMGLNIGAADPREIAVSIVAELVAEVRGVKEVRPW